MSLKDYFNPIWRQARALRDMVLKNPDFIKALAQLEEAALRALLAFVLEEVLRRRLVVSGDTKRQIAHLAGLK
jgi:hypothetical protein